ncbi:MAG: hypothetical protein EHM28_05690 [Spirochaetaceae bacterium]|nr:MAG: hypothetical protein EHM28_05690 [Spirochaetaceae bacterium]
MAFFFIFPGGRMRIVHAGIYPKICLMAAVAAVAVGGVLLSTCATGGTSGTGGTTMDQVPKEPSVTLSASDYILYVPGAKHQTDALADLSANGFVATAIANRHFSLVADSATGQRVLRLSTIDGMAETFKIPLSGAEKRLTLIFKARGALDPDNNSPYGLFCVTWQRGGYSSRLVHNAANTIRGSEGMTRLSSYSLVKAWHEYRLVFETAPDGTAITATVFIDGKQQHQSANVVSAGGEGNFLEFGENEAGSNGFGRFSYILVIKEIDVRQNALATIGKAVSQELVTVPALANDPDPAGRRPVKQPADINMTAADASSTDQKYVDPAFITGGKLNLASLPYSRVSAQKVTATPVFPKSFGLMPVLVVDKTGKDGAYTSIKAVLAAAKPGSVIYLKPGFYQEKIIVTTPDLMFIGESPVNTIIYGYEANSAGIGGNVLFDVDPVDGSFWAENLTFYNKGAEWNKTYGNEERRSVAFGARRLGTAFLRNCVFLGQQDTMYLRAGRMMLANCYIEGEVDFICGGGTVIFDNCHIHSLNHREGGYITAAAPSDTMGQGVNNGYVFRNCRRTFDPAYKGRNIFLGRGAWTGGSGGGSAQAKVVFLMCQLHEQIAQAGWKDWDAISTAAKQFYREYKCTGPGSIKADTATRKLLTDAEYASTYSTTEKILGFTPKMPYEK